jgi:hypothetical protein
MFGPYVPPRYGGTGDELETHGLHPLCKKSLYPDAVATGKEKDVDPPRYDRPETPQIEHSSSSGIIAEDYDFCEDTPILLPDTEIRSMRLKHMLTPASVVMRKPGGLNFELPVTLTKDGELTYRDKSTIWLPEDHTGVSLKNFTDSPRPGSEGQDTWSQTSSDDSCISVGRIFSDFDVEWTRFKAKQEARRQCKLAVVDRTQVDFNKAQLVPAVQEDAERLTNAIENLRRGVVFVVAEMIKESTGQETVAAERGGNTENDSEGDDSISSATDWAPTYTW